MPVFIGETVVGVLPHDGMQVVPHLAAVEQQQPTVNQLIQGLFKSCFLSKGFSAASES